MTSKLDIFNSRLLDLYEIASEEGITINDDSVSDIESFLEVTEPGPDHYNITDDGFIYAVWKDENSGSWLEIEFHTNDQCKTHLFKKKPNSILIIPDIDLITIDEAKELLAKFNS